MARSLGLDIGNRRIGVAVSDAIKLIARPLGVIDRKTERAVERIAAFVAQQQVDEVIVGLPYNADGSKGEQAARVEQFVAQLGLHLAVPIHFCDERYSTLAAREIMAGKKQKTPKDGDDAIAAAVILQRALDERRAKQPDEPDKPDEFDVEMEE